MKGRVEALLLSVLLLLILRFLMLILNFLLLVLNRLLLVVDLFLMFLMLILSDRPLDTDILVSSLLKAFVSSKVVK